MADTIVGERTFALQQVPLKDARKNAYNGIVSILEHSKRLDFSEIGACSDIAEFFSSSKNYSAGALVYFEGELYKATENVSAGAFNPSKWSRTNLFEYVTETLGYADTQRSNIITAINDKGVVAPVDAKLSDLPALIEQITGGGGDLTLTMKPILPFSGGKVILCDESGYIGFKSLPVYAPSAYTSYAIVVGGADFSSAGLGQVTILTPGVADIGGRTYRTTTINGVTWLAENLDYKASGITIGEGGYSDSTPMAHYYNNNESTYGVNGKKFGLLYNWPAVMHLHNNRSTLIPGWHVPSTAEWDALANAVGGTGVAGTKLKAATEWSSGAGSDDFGFSAFPGGNRYNGSFNNLGSRAYFWTSTENSSSNAYNRYFGTGASLNSNYDYKNYEFSLRLVQDS